MYTQIITIYYFRRFDSYYKIMQTTNDLLEVKVVRATEFRDRADIGVGDIARYPMRSNPRGIVIIVNNVNFENSSNRTGSTVDEKNLNQLFTEMGFYVIVRRDLTGKVCSFKMLSTSNEKNCLPKINIRYNFQQIKEDFRRFSKTLNLSKYDSFFAIICSHGKHTIINDSEHSEIHGTDYGSPGSETVTDIDITDNFSTSECLELAGKPKVFIFQTCR